jgi:hypothetical protein
MLCCWALHGIFCCCSGETVVTQLIPKVPEQCNMTGLGGQWEVIEGDRGGEAQDNLAVHHEADAHIEPRDLGRYNEDHTEGKKPASEKANKIQKRVVKSHHATRSKRNQRRWLEAITEEEDPSRRQGDEVCDAQDQKFTQPIHETTNIENTSYRRQQDGEDACLNTADEEQNHGFKAYLAQKAVEKYSGVEDYMGVEGSEIAPPDAWYPTMCVTVSSILAEKEARLRLVLEYLGERELPKVVEDEHRVEADFYFSA